MKKIILVGNAITADILYAYLKNDTRYEVLATTVDDEFLASSDIKDLPTVAISQIATAFPPSDAAIIMAIGYDDLNRGRESVFVRVKGMGYAIETYVHPDARVYTEHQLGEGSIILPGTVVEPHVRIGANTIVWCNATLAHHSTVAENCWIASGAVISGQATISRNTFIGVNSAVVNKVTVGEFNIVGAGALITKHTKPNTVHLARSAEELRFSAEEYVKFVGV